VTRDERQAKSEGGKARSAASGTTLMSRGKESSSREVRRVAILTMKINPGARTQKDAKIKYPPTILLKTNGRAQT
jgi:hypothetical protein